MAEKVIKTASTPTQVELVADRNEIDADGYDLSYVSVLIKDKDGNIVPTADNLVRFFVEGAGEIAAVGNGDSATLSPFQADYRRAFNGKAMLIVRSKQVDKGVIKISAYSEQLSSNTIQINVKRSAE